MSSHGKKSFVIALSCIPFILFVSIGVISNIQGQRQAKSSTGLHQAQILSHAIRSDWEVNNVISNGSPQMENLFTYQNKVYFYGAINSLNFDLWQIDQQNGEFVEKIPISGFGSLISNSEIDTLIADEGYLYILTTGEGGTGASGWVEFSVIDLSNGERYWAERTQYVNNIIKEFVVFNETAIWQNSAGDYYTANLKQRALIQLADIPRNTNSTYLAYTGLDQNATQADKRFWEQKLGQSIYPPLESDNKLVIPIAKLKFAKVNIEVLDKENQAVLFRLSDPIMSNLAIQGDFVYFLTDENYLARTDLESGVTEKLVKFNGEQFKWPSERKYSLSTNQNRLIVYLGDSRQLFAFAFN